MADADSSPAPVVDPGPVFLKEPSIIFEGKAKRHADYAKRLLTAIAAISVASPSGVRALLDAFPRFISPQMAKWGGQDFPATIRKHPAHPEKSTAQGFDSLLVFHVGSAILAYYDTVRGAYDHLYDVLESRTKKLERLASNRSAFVMSGDDVTGYYLKDLGGVK